MEYENWSKEEIINIIDKYLSDGLTDKELHNFKQLMDMEKEIKEEVIFQSKLKFALRNEDEIEIANEVKEMLSDIDMTPHYQIKNYDDPLKSSFSPKFKVIGVFLTISIITIVAFFLLQDGGMSMEIQIAKENTIHFKPSTKSLPQDVDENLRIGFEAYNNEEYEIAVNSLQNYLDTNLDVEMKFYQGVAMLQIDRTEDAIQLFQSLLIQDQYRKDACHYYLGMAYLKKQNRFEAILELKKAGDDTVYGKKSKEVLLLLEE